MAETADKKQDYRSAAEQGIDVDYLSILEPVVKSADDYNPARKKTAGEIAFDRGVYTGIGFGLNELISLIFSVTFEHGSGKYIGKEGFEKASEWIAKTFKFKDKIIDGGHISASRNAGNTLLWISLTSGGFALLLPMKWLENHKNEVTCKLNHAIDRIKGNKLTKEEIAARDAEVEHAIGCQPMQTWPSLIKGRLIAVAASIGLGTLMGEAGSENIKQFSDSVLSGLAGRKPINGGPFTGNFHHYTRLMGVETVSCATASVVLEVASKFFAKASPVARNKAACDYAHGNKIPSPKVADISVEAPGSLAKSVKSSSPYTQKIIEGDNQPAGLQVAL